MGPMHETRLESNGGEQSVNGVANIAKIREMCETNEWDTFFNQLYAMKALDGTPLSELEEEKCLERARYYAKIGTEPFASNFLRMVRICLQDAGKR
eukprot:2744614-Rhodomonas_salina.1